MSNYKVSKTRKEVLRRVAAKLRGLREQLGLSHSEMARRFGVVATSWFRYEGGRRLAGPDILETLLLEHGISIDWLYFDHGPMKAADREGNEALRERIAQLETELGSYKQNERGVAVNEKALRFIQKYEKEVGEFPDPRDISPEMLKTLDLMRRDRRMALEIMLLCEKEKEND